MKDLPQKIAETVKKIAAACPVEFMQELKASDVMIVSQRTVKFNVPAEAGEKINQIKVTHDNGKFMVRFYQVTEVEMLYDLPAENVSTAIKAVLDGQKAVTPGDQPAAV